MTTIMYLFDLKPEVGRLDYETWARNVDLPALRGLASVLGYRILRVHDVGPTGIQGAAACASYIEILDVTGREQFDADMAAAEMVDVANSFRGFVAAPAVLIMDEVESPEDVRKGTPMASAISPPTHADQPIRSTQKEQLP